MFSPFLPLFSGRGRSVGGGKKKRNEQYLITAYVLEHRTRVRY